MPPYLWIWLPQPWLSYLQHVTTSSPPLLQPDPNRLKSQVTEAVAIKGASGFSQGVEPRDCGGQCQVRELERQSPKRRTGDPLHPWRDGGGTSLSRIVPGSHSSSPGSAGSCVLYPQSPESLHFLFCTNYLIPFCVNNPRIRLCRSPGPVLHMNLAMKFLCCCPWEIVDLEQESNTDDKTPCRKGRKYMPNFLT